LNLSKSVLWDTGRPVEELLARLVPSPTISSNKLTAVSPESKHRGALGATSFLGGPVPAPHVSSEIELHLPLSFLHMARGGAHLALIGAAGGGQASWHRALVPQPALPPLRHPSPMHSASPHSLSHPLIGATDIPSSFTLSSSTTDGSSTLSSIFNHRPCEEPKTNAFSTQLKKLFLQYLPPRVEGPDRPIAYTLHRTRLHQPATFVALYLLQHLKARFPAAKGSSGHHLFISASMLSSKIICDDTYSNKPWCVVGQGMLRPTESTRWNDRCAPTWSGSSTSILLCYATFNIASGPYPPQLSLNAVHTPEFEQCKL